LFFRNEISNEKFYFQKILYAKDVDQRSSTFEKSIEMGKEYQKRTKAVILRTLVMKYNISVKVSLNSVDKFNANFIKCLDLTASVFLMLLF
jgi:hypothetical protein